MHCRSLHRLTVAVAVAGLIFSSLDTVLVAGAQEPSSKRGRKFKPMESSARIEVTVVRDSSGKPLVNASVIFHSIENGKYKGNMELKTNEDGKALIDILPVGGTVRMQIIAIEIRMKRPGEQYSVYKPHPEASEGGKDSDAPKPAVPPADKPAAPAQAPADKPMVQPDKPPQPK